MTNQQIIDYLRTMARDVRRPRPPEWTEEEANERMARQLERLAERIAKEARDG